MLHLWIKEFLDHIAARQPAFIALHLQEVGGKTYEKSMEYVQEFIKQLCESDELQGYNRIRVYLDEDYNSAEHFTVRKAGMEEDSYLLALIKKNSHAHTKAEPQSTRLQGQILTNCES